MEGVVLHLYGFVRSSLRPPALEGIEPGSNVFFVTCGEVSCAATVVHAADYTGSPAVNQSDRAAWLTARALRHHEVITELHEAGGVLPLKFGTTCRDEADVRGMLEDLRDTLTDLLATVAVKEEWTLKISADTAAIAERSERESAALLALREAEAALPDGRAYFARKQRTRETASHVALRLAEMDDAVCGCLAALAVPIVRSERGGADGLRDAALLITRRDVGAITRVLSALQEEHAWCGLSFTLVGPWAPYSFVPTFDRAIK